MKQYKDNFTLAFELRERVARREKLIRYARRYLDEHCDRHGRRMLGGMSVGEYAQEIGVCAGIFERIVADERRARVRANAMEVSA